MCDMCEQYKQRADRWEEIATSAREVSAQRAKEIYGMKTFYKNLIYFFEHDKTSWGRVELVAKIKEIYIEALEDNVETVSKAKAEGDLEPRDGFAAAAERKSGCQS